MASKKPHLFVLILGKIKPEAHNLFKSCLESVPKSITG